MSLAAACLIPLQLLAPSNAWPPRVERVFAFAQENRPEIERVLRL